MFHDKTLWMEFTLKLLLYAKSFKWFFFFFFLSGTRKLIFLFELFKSFKNSLFSVHFLLREITTNGEFWT